MEYLDRDESVKEFKYECLKIPYMSNSRTKRVRNYIPDVLVTYVDGRQILVEIKPSSRVLNKTNVKKFEAATRWCVDSGIEFVVITEVELKRLGLL